MRFRVAEQHKLSNAHSPFRVVAQPEGRVKREPPERVLAYYRYIMTWEYMVREFDVQDSDKILLLEEFLNEAAKDGWELVGVAITPTEQFTHLVYLKRRGALAERLELTPPPQC